MDSCVRRSYKMPLWPFFAVVIKKHLQSAIWLFNGGNITNIWYLNIFCPISWAIYNCDFWHIASGIRLYNHWHTFRSDLSTHGLTSVYSIKFLSQDLGQRAYGDKIATTSFRSKKWEPWTIVMTMALRTIGLSHCIENPLSSKVMPHNWNVKFNLKLINLSIIKTLSKLGLAWVYHLKAKRLANIER